MIVTGDQIRMARALLRMSVRELSEAATVDKSTISRIENGADAYTSTFRQLRSVLEARGAWFGEVEDGAHGPTVGLKWGVELLQRPANSSGSGTGEAGQGISAAPAAWDD